MPKKKKNSRIDELTKDVTADAYTYDEQLWAFLNAFEEQLDRPVDAHVLGEPVELVKIDYHGNERRGLTAQVKKDGSTSAVSLADVEFAAGSREADLADALRQVMGIEPVERKAAEAKQTKARQLKKKHKADVEAIEVGKPVDVVVLANKTKATRLQLLDSGREITLRSSLRLRAVPGEIATVIPKKVWSFNKHPYMSLEEIKGFRIDAAALGLIPLELEEWGTWEPTEHYWGEGEELEDWAQLIFAHGPRPQYEMEQVVPGDEPSVVEDGREVWTDGPILDAIHQRRAGNKGEAHRILSEVVAQDLRCLDAHAHLASFAFDVFPDVASRHYQVGMEIGLLSLGEDFNGVLPWGCLDNRPFLRCLHGYGLCLWRHEREEEALAVFERMLWLNPTDNLGARFLRSDLKAGRTWEESCLAEQASSAF